MQHARLPCPSPTSGACSNSCPSSRWYHTTIISSVVPFSSCLQSFPASGSFQMSHFFTSSSQSMGASASASVLPMNIQDWFPLGITALISFRMDLLALLAVQGTLKSLLQYHSSKASIQYQNHQEAQTAAVAAAKSLQLCPTLCDPIDGLLPGSSVPGTLQARTLEWVSISFSNAWKWKVKVKSLSRVQLLETPWTAAFQAPPSMGFSRQEYWNGVPLPSPEAQTTTY